MGRPEVTRLFCLCLPSARHDYARPVAGRSLPRGRARLAASCSPAPRPPGTAPEEPSGITEKSWSRGVIARPTIFTPSGTPVICSRSRSRLRTYKISPLNIEHAPTRACCWSSPTADALGARSEPGQGWGPGSAVSPPRCTGPPLRHRHGSVSTGLGPFRYGTTTALLRLRIHVRTGTGSRRGSTRPSARPSAPPGAATRWLAWRRRHQALSTWYHHRTRLARDELILLVR